MEDEELWTESTNTDVSDEEFMPDPSPHDLGEDAVLPGPHARGDEEFMPDPSPHDLGEDEAMTDASSRDLGEERGLGQHVGVNDRPHGPDFPFVSVPTISPAVFEAWLKARHSPILDEAPALTYYRAAMSKGINPGVALAFFHHESQCGGDTSIIPAGTRNWGNLRPRTDGSLGRGVRKVSTSVGVFRGYNRWLDGLLDWCDLWFLSIYKGKTITQALQIYAPSGDGNNPHGYANTVLALLKQWDQQSGDFDIPGDGGTPAPTPPATTGTLADAPLLGPPSVPVEMFTKALSDAGSPALQEANGADLFTLCVSNGVDPAVALAFFGQTSQYGTIPGSAARKNWGYVWDAQANAARTYGAWREGLADWLHRVQGPAYTAGGPPTVTRMVPIYRGPNASNPDNATYTRQLLDRIATLASSPRDLGFEAGTRDLGGAGAGDRPHGPDYPVRSGPSISPALFAQVLEGYQSPALIEAPALDYYMAVMDTGINPALALAVFERESGCDTDPDNPLVKAVAKNWGGLRVNPNGNRGRAAGTVQTPAGAYRAYTSYMDGLHDWCEFVGSTFGSDTIAHALARVAPGDAHSLNSYAETILRRIAEWDAASGLFDLPSDSRDLGGAPAPKWVGCSPKNYWAGRQGHTILAVVNHEMQGSLEGTRQAFLDPNHAASAHYGVGRDGTVLQFIKEEDTAWANGPLRNPNTGVVPWLADAQRDGTNPNRLTVTIEWEGSQVGTWHKVQFNGETHDTLDPATISKWFTPSDAQYQAGLALIRAICARQHITIDRAHICRHSDVDSVTKWFCPGEGFPLQRLIEDLSGQQGGNAGGPPTDAPLTGAASIPVEAFTKALSDAGSPALQEANGADYYNMCVSNGVDPAVALAFFGQTSNYGTAGDAAHRMNWGNLWDSGANAFGTYGTWREGLADWLHRVQGPAYTAGGPPTITRIVPIYRGRDAQNPDNTTYTGQLLARLGQLRGG